MQYQMQYLLMVLGGIQDRIAKEERGATAVEWVVISAVLAALAVGLGVTIKNLVQSKSDEITLDP